MAHDDSFSLPVAPFPISSDRRDVVVIGASAGGIVPLVRVLSGLPEDLAAAVFAVVHIAQDRPSSLPAILNRAGPFDSDPLDEAGEGIRYGHVYVGAPGRHLTVASGRVKNGRGPKVGSYRPSVDKLFRSAAAAFGSRVVGVVLSGFLSDGSKGLREIQERGGTTIVQDPAEAEFSSMPRNAIAANTPDHCVPSGAIASLICRLTAEVAPPLAKLKASRGRIASPRPDSR